MDTLPPVLRSGLLVVVSLASTSVLLCLLGLLDCLLQRPILGGGTLSEVAILLVV